MGRGLTVITPHLEERAELLADLSSDLMAQSARFEWRLCTDKLKMGPARIRNVLACQAVTEWLAFIDDDDRVDPDHLEVLLDHSQDADVIYSFGRVEGRDWEIPHDCGLEHIDEWNSVPVTALVRREVFLAAGGFPEDRTEEDWHLWRILKAEGARFRCVHRTTWTYRFHKVGRGNRTWWTHG